jgi:hypothetical protein
VRLKPDDRHGLEEAMVAHWNASNPEENRGASRVLAEMDQAMSIADPGQREGARRSFAAGLQRAAAQQPHKPLTGYLRGLLGPKLDSSP